MCLKFSPLQNFKAYPQFKFILLKFPKNLILNNQKPPKTVWFDFVFLIFQSFEAVTTSNNDLINLEANSSFEIEDFDPLNENAKPIPHVPSFTKSATSSPPTSSLTVNNGQINPYFTPQHHANHFSTMSMSLVAHKKPETQDDIELLRTYGLDKFTLLDAQNGGKEDGKFANSNGTKNPFKDGFLTQQRPSSSSRSFSMGQSSWTTFEWW